MQNWFLFSEKCKLVFALKPHHKQVIHLKLVIHTLERPQTVWTHNDLWEITGKA